MSNLKILVLSLAIGAAIYLGFSWLFGFDILQWTAEQKIIFLLLNLITDALISTNTKRK
jgi:type IV secretory pathway VirB2 component (pilin)